MFQENRKAVFHRTDINDPGEWERSLLTENLKSKPYINTYIYKAPHKERSAKKVKEETLKLLDLF